MTHGYREAFRLPGSRAFTSAAFVARMPVAIINLGVILFVSGTTGSYAKAGAVSAAYTLSAAVGSILTSRLADRRGQGRVLAILAGLNAIGLIALVAGITNEIPLGVCLLIAAFAGACQPAVGSMVRARWAHAARTSGATALVRPAFALESILDELVFSIGPLIAAWASIALGLGSPLLIAAALVCLGGWALAAQKRSEPEIHTDSEHSGSALKQRGMLSVACVALGVGAVFGSYEVAVVAFCGAAGSQSMSGIVLALWATGSAIGGLWFGTRRWRQAPSTQLLVLCAVLVAVLLPALAAPNIFILILVTTAGGAAVAPTLITVFGISERIVPPRLLTEGLAFAISAMTVGFAAGAALGGALVDQQGPKAGFGLAIVGAVWSLVVAATRRRALESALLGASSMNSEEPIIPLGDDPITGIAPPRG